MELYYDPQDPGNFQIPSFTEQYSAAVAATVAGAVIVIIGLVVFWVGLLAKRRMVTPPRTGIQRLEASAGSSVDKELGELTALEQEEIENMKKNKGR